MIRVLGLILGAAIGYGQVGPAPGITDTYNHYQIFQSTSLSGAVETVTVQQNATPSYTVIFESATLYCSVACTVTFSWNGTKATTTAITPIALNNAPIPQAKAFKSSNASGGVTGPTFNIPAGGTMQFDLSKFQLGINNDGNQNLTVASSSITGTFSALFQWIER